MTTVTTTVAQSNLDKQIADAQAATRQAFAALTDGNVAQLQLKKSTAPSNCLLSTAQVTPLGTQLAIGYGIPAGNVQFTVSNTTKGSKILSVASYDGDTRLGSKVLCELADDEEGTIGISAEGLIFTIDGTFALDISVPA